MNEFKDKFNSSELIWNAIVEIDHNKANVGLLVETISAVFKDWQPPTPKELVKVKPFVAEWFETNKEDSNYMNWKYISELFSDKQIIDSFHEWLREDNGSIETLYRMKLEGYRVEKPEEKLYFVKLPGVPALDAYLCKSCSPGELGYHKEYSSKEPNKISFSSRYDKKYYGGWQRQFTEPEIKAIDERFWAFAVPVEDEEMK